MAQKRMLDKKISVSEQVANLSTEAQLVFTWGIPHADDLGLLPDSHRTLKALIVPMKDWLLEDFGAYVGEIVGQKLWTTFKHGGETFYRFPAFFATQTLKKDRKPVTLLTSVKTWEDAERLGFQLEDNGFQMEDIGNPREEKRSKEKKEDTGGEPPKPTWEEKIRVKDPEYKALVQDLQSSDYLSAASIHQIVLDEFLPYWLERSEGARKSRWQMERAFDYRKRIRTWIKKNHEIRKDFKCRTGLWHRKGESCHCIKEEVPLRREISPAARALGLAKRVTHDGHEDRQTREQQLLRHGSAN